MRLSSTLFLIAALVLPGPAEASGGLRQLSLQDAVREAGLVLVVKKAKPFTEESWAYVPYRKGGKQRRAKIKTHFVRIEIVEVLGSRMSLLSSTSGESLMVPGKKHTFKPQDVKVGRVFRVVDSGTTTNHRVRARYLQDGTRKIPIYRRLGDALSVEELQKATRFVFLGSYSLAYEALEGVGGSGLVSAKHLRKIRRLLKKR